MRPACMQLRRPCRCQTPPSCTPMGCCVSAVWARQPTPAEPRRGRRRAVRPACAPALTRSHPACATTAAGADGDPYWTRVWPSAIALAQMLLQRPQLVAGRKVCDLGCGLGVGGIAAALAGDAPQRLPPQRRCWTTARACAAGSVDHRSGRCRWIARPAPRAAQHATARAGWACRLCSVMPPPSKRAAGCGRASCRCQRGGADGQGAPGPAVCHADRAGLGPHPGDAPTWREVAGGWTAWLLTVLVARLRAHWAAR